MSFFPRKRSWWILSAVAGAVTCPLTSANDSTWTHNGGGDWATATNWSAGVPNGVDDDATFAGAITSAAAINQNVSGLTLGSIVLQDNDPYTISGNSINLDVVAGLTQVQSLQGNHTIAAPLSLSDTLSASCSAAAGVTLSGVISGLAGIQKIGTGTLTLAGSASNTFIGNTSVVDGTLRLSAASSPWARAVPARPRTSLSSTASRRLARVWAWRSMARVRWTVSITLPSSAA